MAVDGEEGKVDDKGTQGNWKGMGMFMILTVAMASQVYTYIKADQVVCFVCGKCVVHQFYFN